MRVRERVWVRVRVMLLVVPRDQRAEIVVQALHAVTVRRVLFSKHQ